MGVRLPPPLGPCTIAAPHDPAPAHQERIREYDPSPPSVNQSANSTVRVAVVQAEVPQSIGPALAEVERQVTLAAAAGCAIIVFGETWLPGYPAWLDHCPGAALWDHAPTKAVFARLADDSVDVAGEEGAALARIAAGHHVTIVIGVVERVGSGPGRGTLYNSLLTYGPDGGLLNHHRKLVPTYTERLVWGPGDTQGLRAVDSAGVRVGGLVCWEHWMPLARHALHESGEDVHVAVWPTAHEMHQVASRHYAFEGRCFVLVAAGLMRAGSLPPELERTDAVRDDNSWVLRGGSAIVGPDGNYVVEPVWDGPALLVAELPLRRVREGQLTLDVSGHYHRPDCFTFEVTRAHRRT